MALGVQATMGGLLDGTFTAPNFDTATYTLALNNASQLNGNSAAESQALAYSGSSTNTADQRGSISNFFSSNFPSTSSAGSSSAMNSPVGQALIQGIAANMTLKMAPSTADKNFAIRG
jgi:hypothetical protein